MSIVSSLNIAKDALAVNQAAITVVSNNIANVDTEGYSKLRVNQSSVVSVTGKAGYSAIIEAESLSGVKLDSITRYSDSFMQSYFWDQNSVSSYYDAYANTAGSIEDLVNEFQDAGFSDAIDAFYSAVNALSTSPSDYTARTNYVSAAENLCSVFNSISSNLSSIEESLVGTASDVGSSSIAGNMDSINSLLDQITEVNKSIIGTNSDGTSVSALLDKRDSLVTSLSALVNVKTQDNANGTIDISLGNYKLVDGASVEGYLKASNTLDTDNNIVTTISIIDPENSTREIASDVNSEITGGSTAAILDAAGTNVSKLTVSSVMKDVDAMANAFAEVMNRIQTTADVNGTPMCMNSTGTALSPTTVPLLNLFTTKDASATVTAANIRVNQGIINNPYAIAAARVTNTTDLTAIGNASNMTQVVNARTNASYFSGTDIQGSTLEGYLSSTVSGIGGSVDKINGSQSTQNSVLSTVKSRLSSINGVNLDEELTDLIKYQRAYEAAARVFSVCNELLEDLVNLGR